MELHTHLSTIDDMPQDSVAMVVPYTTGLKPEPLTTSLGSDSMVLTILMAVIVATVLVMRHSARYFRSAAQNLLMVRSRENAFDERTINEDAIVVTLNIAVALSGAILLYAILCRHSGNVATTFAWLLALTSSYIIAQYAAYAIIGYTFTSRSMASQWLAGFSSSQSFLGLGLIFPAAAVLFYPDATTALAIVSALIYLSARICFICKGFRIFFDNIFSLVYFISYLCASEIIPILLVYRKAVELCC